MYSTPAQFTEMQQGYLDALNALAGTLVNATEQVAALNIAAGQAIFQDASDAARHLLDSKDPQQAMAVAGGLVQPATGKMVGFSRNAYGIASGVGADLYKIVDTQVAEGRRKLEELFETSLKNAPPGAEATVLFLKSAMAASNSAYEAIASATKKSAQMAEAKFDAVAASATKAAT
jgi:phasin family protein